MKQGRTVEIEPGRFYEIEDLIKPDEGEIIVRYINCDTSGECVTDSIMVCDNIDIACLAVEHKLVYFSVGEGATIDSECDNTFAYQDEFYITFRVYGDHHNDNFTRIEVKGPLDGADCKRLFAIVNKYIKSE